MNIAVLMNDNAYAGREYLDCLEKAKISVDVIIFGKYPIKDVFEDKRCSGLWNPKKISQFKDKYTIYRFSSIKEKNFLKHLDNKKYSLGVQGGTNIIKDEVFLKFKLGIINFHPGNLPRYAGCTAPEWQVYEGKKIFCTCHFIDDGIDTGPILKKKKLNVHKNSYGGMRASIYPEIAKFLIDIIKQLQSGDKNIFLKINYQKINNRTYRKPISNTKLKRVKQIIKNNYKVSI